MNSGLSVIPVDQWNNQYRLDRFNQAKAGKNKGESNPEIANVLQTAFHYCVSLSDASFSRNCKIPFFQNRMWNPDPAFHNLTPLMGLIMQGREARVRMLLDIVLPPQLRMTDTQNWTALDHAAFHSDAMYRILQVAYRRFRLPCESPIAATRRLCLEPLLLTHETTRIKTQEGFTPISKLAAEQLQQLTGLRRWQDNPTTDDPSVIWKPFPKNSDDLDESRYLSFKAHPPQLDIKPEPGISGWSVVSREFIPKGSIVCLYGGQVRGGYSGSHAMKFLTGASIDPRHGGNVAQFVNQSFPNLVIKRYCTFSGGLNLALTASRDIRPGEDLYVEYSPTHALNYGYPMRMLGDTRRECRQFFNQPLVEIFGRIESGLDLSRALYPAKALCYLVDHHFSGVQNCKNWLTLYRMSLSDPKYEEYFKTIQYDTIYRTIFLMTIQAVLNIDGANVPVKQWILDNLDRHQFLNFIAALQQIGLWQKNPKADWETFKEQTLLPLLSGPYLDLPCFQPHFVAEAIMLTLREGYTTKGILLTLMTLIQEGENFIRRNPDHPDVNYIRKIMEGQQYLINSITRVV